MRPAERACDVRGMTERPQTSTKIFLDGGIPRLHFSNLFRFNGIGRGTFIRTDLYTNKRGSDLKDAEHIHFLGDCVKLPIFTN